jgi:hypothetical protein
MVKNKIKKTISAIAAALALSTTAYKEVNKEKSETDPSLPKKIAVFQAEEKDLENVKILLVELEENIKAGKLPLSKLAEARQVTLSYLRKTESEGNKKKINKAIRVLAAVDNLIKEANKLSRL